MNTKYKKIGILFLFIACLLTYIYFGWWRMPLPWKVTDPLDPRFVEENFRFEDYRGEDGYKQMQEALRVMFPIGTPKEKVDRILFELQPKYTKKQDSGGWREGGKIYYQFPEEKNVWGYFYSFGGLSINIINLHVIYDSNHKVKEITDHGVPLLNSNALGDR